MCRIAIYAVALLLALAPAASASMWPAPSRGTAKLTGIRVLKAPHGRAAARSCAMERGLRSKAARWLAPVACEQPPRSQLVLPLLGG